MIFSVNEKELLLKLITIEQSRLAVQNCDENKTIKIIEVHDVIKKKIKKV